jgi:hypothetical protein
VLTTDSAAGEAMGCEPQNMFTAVMAIIFSSQAIGVAATNLTDVDQAVDSCASILTIVQRQLRRGVVCCVHCASLVASVLVHQRISPPPP